MVQSGAKPNQAAVDAFQRVMRQDNRWAIFKFDWSKGKFDENNKKLDEDVVTVAEVGGKTSNFELMLKALPKDQCRYIAYDCQYTTENAQNVQKRSKVLLVAWSNDDCHSLEEIRMKMLLTSTMKEVLAKFSGFAKKCTINDEADLTEENFVDIVSEGKTK